MQAPDTQDEMYKNLQEQAVKHIMAQNVDSPVPDPAQQLAVAQAQYAPMVSRFRHYTIITPS